jgi:uncharacterized protein (TIGR03067 family)
MRPLFFAIALLGAISALGNALSGTETANSTKELDGTWQCISIVGFGIEEPDAVVKKIKFEFAGSRIMVTNGAKIATARIKTNFTKKPAEIDILPQDGQAPGEIQRGVFAVNKDDLFIRFANFGAKRPESLAFGQSTVLMKFKRTK